MSCRKNSPGKPCCGSCCGTITPPNVDWTPNTGCCSISKITTIPSPVWTTACSTIRTQTASGSVDFKIYLRDYGILSSDTAQVYGEITCSDTQCTTEDGTVLPCSSDAYLCGTVTSSFSASREDVIILKYRIIRYETSIIRVDTNCDGTGTGCKYVAVSRAVAEFKWDQVALIGLTQSLTPVNGCCKRNGVLYETIAPTCESQTLRYSSTGYITCRMKVFDTMPTGDIEFTSAVPSCTPYPTTVNGCSIACTGSTLTIYSGPTAPLGYGEVTCVCGTISGNRCSFIMLAPSSPNFCDRIVFPGGPTFSITTCSLQLINPLLMSGLLDLTYGVSVITYGTDPDCYLSNFCSSRPGPIQPIYPKYHPVKSFQADILCENLTQNFTDTGETPTSLSIPLPSSWTITV